MTRQTTDKAPAVTQVLKVTHQDGSVDLTEVVTEAPVAIVFNGTSAAVMMATPCDLRDMAYGFAMTEGYISDLGDVESFEVVQHSQGLEGRFWVRDSVQEAIVSRRRAMAGPVGCGLCGIDSLEAVQRPISRASNSQRLMPDEITSAMAQISNWQPLKQSTRATHAAALYVPGKGIVAAREDVGRHNALDKLAGHMTQNGIDGTSGAVVMTSRISLELVQKAAFLKVPVIIAPSAPTSLAIEVARLSGVQIVGFCRGSNYQVFC